MHLNPNLKIIIMSATIDVDSFVSYFNNCPVLKIPGKLFEVQTFYLEDVLKLTNFTNDKVKEMKVCGDPVILKHCLTTIFLGKI